jgi:hypothetical protein
MRNRFGLIGLGSLMAVAAWAGVAGAAGVKGTPGDADRKFAQLETVLPTPGETRSGSGAPGARYWQQRADYRIKVSLDESKHRLTGSAVISYTNRSPDTLTYIWLQLDQNTFKDGSVSRLTETTQTTGARGGAAGSGDSVSYGALRRQQAFQDTPFGVELGDVTSNGRKLHTAISDTMARVDLETPLRSGQTIALQMNWSFNIINEAAIGGRSGYEHFPDNNTYLYFIAQWFPRLVAYTDYTGWQHKQFLGRGEFTLEFGDYEVDITVPSDHVVSSTGVLQNADAVLTAEQRARLKKAETATAPVFVVTPAEALAAEKGKPSGTRTWRFKAQNVRDFAWASSRKFIWDAMGYKQADAQAPKVLAMSFYPNEAEPVWSRYSTQAVIHTLESYSKLSFPYPYPTAQSVNTWDRGGMEYPMLSFNGYRPSKDEKSGKVTYSSDVKYGLIGVVIHEVGHNYFPMIVNSDERQWTWMDEGLNTFLEYQAELAWEDKFPAFGNKTNVLDFIPDYMKSANQVPIMTNSESVVQFGPNGYTKPTAALTVLRETVMGRELFDHAFREYANRWKFKRPTPADFFRTMEDASGVDLDWFWRGWFYGTDYVDVDVAAVREYQLSSQDPDKEFPLARERFAQKYPRGLDEERTRAQDGPSKVERDPSLKDFYNENNEFTVTNKDRNEYKEFREKLKPWERDALDRALKANEYFYFVDFHNMGGLVTPLPLTLHFADGSSESYMVPAEVWRYDASAVSQLIVRPKRVVAIEVDARHQTGDADFTNNIFPRRITPTKLEVFKGKSRDRNLMLDMMTELKSDKAAPKDDGAAAPLKPVQ